MEDTRGAWYAHRLQRKSGAWWKRVLDVQAPYRWNLRRQDLGRTLDVGCGIGRNLASLPPGSVGIDHNATSVEEARRRGLAAFTSEEWAEHPLRVPGAFDSLLLAHVVEHMDEPTAQRLLLEHLPQVRPGGTVLFVCPQERGYASDATHVWFVDLDGLRRLAVRAGLEVERSWSFPLPRAAGRVFTYNESCLRARVP